MSDYEKKMNQIQEVFVNSETLAEFFECSVRTVQRYAEEKSLLRIEGKGYPLFESLLWYISKLKNEIDNQSENNPLIKEKIMTQYLINREKVLSLRQQAKKLVPADTSGIITTNIVRTIVSRLEAFPYELNTLVGGDSLTLVKFKEAVNDLRKDISDHYQNQLPERMKELEEALELDKILGDEINDE